MTADPRVDLYIEHAAPFAQPMLVHLRAVMHAGCPDLNETIKWRMPFFMHADRIVGDMATFKQHCWASGAAVAVKQVLAPAAKLVAHRPNAEPQWLRPAASTTHPPRPRGPRHAA